MSNVKSVNHNNVFESYLAQDVFMMDVIEKIIHDWKTANRKMPEFNRENLEDFFFDEFHQWVEMSMTEWCDEEWEDEE